MSETKQEINKPVKSIRVQDVELPIWENTIKTKDDKDVEILSTGDLMRNYKDKEGNWKKTGSMRVHDLPKCALAIQRAYEFIVDYKKDKEE